MKSNSRTVRQGQAPRIDCFKEGSTVQKNGRGARRRVAAVRSDRAGLKRSLDKTTAQLQAKTHEAVCLQQEVKTLCGKVDAATLRIKKLKKLLEKKTGSVSQGLRRKIKALCLKYHTDHRGVLSVSNEEVMRDLTELLAA